tara:strand:+ start:534 stop:794 length:261 start_codon:yes stop_codon:yes gene_type:complete
MENKRIYIHSEFQSSKFGLLKSGKWSYQTGDLETHKKSIKDACVEEIMTMVNEWSLNQCWGSKKHESFTQKFSDQLEKNAKIIIQK